MLRPQSHKRTIVEFCCGENSRLGQPRLGLPGCKVIRLTAKDDLRTAAGREAAIRAVSDNPDVLLWVSIPCTGGCPWQKVNANRPASKAKVQAMIGDMEKLWATMVVVAKISLILKLKFSEV